MGNEQTNSAHLRLRIRLEPVGTELFGFGSSHLRWRGPFPECTVPHYAEIQECDSLGNL